MEEFLNHAITVSDVLCFAGVSISLTVAALAGIAVAIHPPYVERRRLKRMQKLRAGECVRNPVYGTPSKPRP